MSDVDDQKDLVGPFRDLIPAENEFEVAGVILAVGAAGVVFMLVQIALLRRRYTPMVEDTFDASYWARQRRED